MTHASFCSRVALEVHEQLRVIGTEKGEAAEFAKNVSYQGQCSETPPRPRLFLGDPPGGPPMPRP